MDPPPQRQTKIDKQLGVVLTLFNLGERLSDAAQVLEEFHLLFHDAGSSKQSKENALQDINKNVIPLLKLASATISNSATVVAPIAGTQYIHMRLESQKKQAAAALVTPTKNVIWGQLTTDRKSQPLRRIENTLATKKMKTRSGKQDRRNSRCVNHRVESYRVESYQCMFLIFLVMP
jgi:hypothetical protein